MNLSDVVFIMIMTIYLFAIGGVSFFQENDYFHFGNLQRALATLMRVSTLDDWTDVMYTEMWGCEQWLENDQYGCEKSVKGGWAAGAYFVIFVIFVALVMVPLFIGIVATAMVESETNLMKENKVKSTATLLQRDLGVSSYGMLMFEQVSLSRVLS